MKRIILFGMIVTGLSVAKADYAYLNFLVDQSSSLDPIAFEYARVGVSGTSTYLNLQGTSSSWVLGETPYTTDSYFVDLSNYASSMYSFFVELYDADFAKVGVSTTSGYDDLKPFIATEMGQGGITDAWTVSSFASVPEPTSGVLLLLGLGVLALRRRKSAMCAVLTLCGLNLLADANDTMITFATKGPDRYADGSVVKDGECYALVWVRSGVDFAGFAADGTVVDTTNGVLLLTAPLADGGKCPTTVFEVSAKLAERYSDGNFEVYLLDTRLADGRVGGISTSGRAVAINGYGRVELSSSASSVAEIASSSAVPADAPAPHIKAIRILGAYAYLTVGNTVPYLQYKPVPVNMEGGASSVGDAAPVQGSADEDIVLVVPATGSSGLYKVVRP